MSMPGRSIGHRKNEMPSCLAASGFVRAIRMPQSLMRPPEHHTFCPLTTKWSPSRSLGYLYELGYLYQRELHSFSRVAA